MAHRKVRIPYQLYTAFFFNNNNKKTSGFKKKISGMVQGLRIHLPMQGAWVQSLVGKLRSHMPPDN